MHQPTCTSYQLVTDETQAAALLDPKTLMFLSPFIGQSRSAKEVAGLLEVKLTTLLYQLKRLSNLGLLEHEDVARAGRPVRHYRAKQKAFFVSYRVSPYATPEEWLLREYEPVERDFLRYFLKTVEARLTDPSPNSFGLWITLNQVGVLQIKHGLHPEHSLPDELSLKNTPPLINAWDDGLWLDETDARTLFNEMQNLLRQYRTKKGSARYFVRMALTPVTP